MKSIFHTARYPKDDPWHTVIHAWSQKKKSPRETGGLIKRIALTFIVRDERVRIVVVDRLEVF